MEVTRNYGQMVPVRLLDFDTLDQEALINVIYSEHFRKYPVSHEYTRSFLKRVIAKCEEKGEEIREDLLELYMSLLGRKEEKEFAYKTYLYGTMNVVLLESLKTISHGTTGLRTWEASLRFGEYLIHHPDLICSSRILELGSGAGFLGILCAKLGANQVIMTDIDDNVLDLCKRNINLNQVDTHATVMQFDWNEFDKELPDFDIIIGADIVYDPDIMTFLASTLCRLLSSETKRLAYIASTVRNMTTYEAFRKICEENHLLLQTIKMNELEIFAQLETESPVYLVCISCT